MLHARVGQLTWTFRRRRPSRRAAFHAFAAGVAVVMLATPFWARSNLRPQPSRARLSTSGTSPVSLLLGHGESHGDPGVRAQRHRGSLVCGAGRGDQNHPRLQLRSSQRPGWCQQLEPDPTAYTTPSVRRRARCRSAPCLALPPFLALCARRSLLSAVSSSGCTPPPPMDVAGLVLVDATHEDNWARLERRSDLICGRKSSSSSRKLLPEGSWSPSTSRGDCRRSTGRPGGEPCRRYR